MDKRLKILAVDDEPVNIQLMSTALRDDYDIITALNGLDTINMIEEHKPDLILLDVMMPDITGFEVCKIIKADERFADIPVIFLTALDTQDGQLQGLELGAIDYLTKPINFALLTLRVRNHLAMKEQRDLLVQQKEKLDQLLAEQESQNSRLLATKAALRQSEEMYRTLFEQSPDGIVLWSVPDLRVVQCNTAAQTLHGYSHDEFTSLTVPDIEAALNPDEVENTRNALLRDGVARFDSVHRTKTGELRNMFVSLKAIELAGQSMILDIHRDITERKRAEDALKEAEWKFRALFDNGPIGVAYHRMIYDDSGKAVDYNFIDANEKYIELTGVDPRGKTVLQAFPGIENDPFDWIGTFGTVAKTGGSIRFEQYLQLNDRWYDVVGYQYKPDHFVAAFLEITDRKKAEEALQESEFRWKFALEGAGDGVWDWNIQTGEAFYSQRYKAMLGFAEDEIGNSSDEWLKRIHPEDAPGVLTALQPYLDGKTGSAIVEFRMLCKDGSWKWIGGRGMVVSRDSYGKPLRMIGTNSDITGRKLEEERMKSLTQRLLLATSSVHLGIWDWNVRDNTLTWDDRMCELYGITRETFPSTIDAWLNGLHPEDKETAIAECQAALKGEKEFDTVFRTRHPDGTVKHLKAAGLVIRGTDGTAERMLGINADISENKRAEEEKTRLQEQLLQAQKMESVGRLAGGVAHDFNNMLSVILGHAELGLKHIDPSHRVCADLKEISKTAERSADLTRQLLAFARKQTVAPKVLDLNVTVAEMLKMLQRLIGEDIHLVWQPAPELWQVRMDPSQIDQIMANLCVNSRDAITGIGRITIETANRTIDAKYCAANSEADPGEYVCLTVSDSGSGMDKETLPHIFEPFYTTKKLGMGTGLGLATVYGAVKQNGGFINIYSEPGLGTTFAIYLPRDESNRSKQQLSETAASPVPRGQETILLVEDEPDILNIASLMLEEQGYIVLKADTPGEAIRLAREHVGEIQLLMTDVIMPEMNGPDLAKILLSLYPHIKRLFMSGYTADVIATHGVLEEGMHFIQKPFSLTNMAEKVREVLDSKITWINS